MTDTLEQIRHKIDGAVDVDPEHGRYRGRREAFTDPDLFELEMKYIFEGNWIYLAHESQLPNDNDYLTTYIGRQPIVISRDKEGAAARPDQRLQPQRRDALPAQEGQPHHLHLPVPRLDVQQQRQAAQGQGPARRRLPGAVQHRGLPRPHEGARASSPTAASCSAASTPTSCRWRSILGDATKIIDMIVDQSPEGLEVLKGSSTYTYDGNWKVQAENGADGYHVSAVHWNYAATTCAAHHGRVGHRDQGDGRRQLGQAAGRLLRLRARPPAAVERVGQPGGPAAVRPRGRTGRRVRPGQGRLDARSRRATCASTRTCT